MKYYLIAGEASGDLHGANLMAEILKNDPDAELRYWGGDRMAAVGGTLVRHYKHHNFMGFVQVVKNLRTILGNVKFCKQDIAENMPDAVIFIDFPGFNLRISQFVKNLGIMTFFYISPTVWAWKENRVKHIKRSVDHLFSILPFEKEFYKTRHNYDIDYVGNPLLDSISADTNFSTLEEFQQKNSLPAKQVIAVLPGSRKSEIDENLATMQSIAGDFSEYQFVIAGMSHFDAEFYQSRITASNVSLVFDQTYQLLRIARAGIIVSGSATLETAIIGCPEMLVFQTGALTYHVGKMLLKLEYYSLPNLVVGRKIINELIQKDMNPTNLKRELNRLLHDESARAQMKADYAEMRERLGGTGASIRTAALIDKYLRAR